MKVWSICKLHKICLKSYLFIYFFMYANKYQALQEKENPFGSLDLQSCIGPTEALTVVLAGDTLISKIRISTSCGLASGVCVGSSLMRLFESKLKSS